MDARARLTDWRNRHHDRAGGQPGDAQAESDRRRQAELEADDRQAQAAGYPSWEAMVEADIARHDAEQEAFAGQIERDRREDERQENTAAYSNCGLQAVSERWLTTPDGIEFLCDINAETGDGDLHTGPGRAADREAGA